MTRTLAAIVLAVTALLTGSHTAGQQSVTCTYGTVRSIAGTFCQPAIASYRNPIV
jgi:hypothetical protein